MTKRILAVDPGDKRSGIAISDPTGTIANPFSVIQHVSRKVDALEIVKLATENEVVRIIIGWALDSEGYPGPQARKAQRLASVISEHTHIPVELWDESDSTRMARSAQVKISSKKKRRQKNTIDSLAATIILQSYLDVQKV
ncbi:MAG: Holliday junction resolvase RuvX [Anaerolineaceae bacterium]|nr:Holliday junction resolvase RuvX [Anaerolineaceae bacterium]